MGDKRLLSRDPVSGLEEWFYCDPMTGDWHLEWTQDCQAQVDAMKAFQNDPEHKRRGIERGFAHYAHWPDAIIIKWRHEYGIDVLNKAHKDAALKKLQDPDWKYLRSCDMHSPRKRVRSNGIFLERDVKPARETPQPRKVPKWAARDGVLLDA